MSHLVPCICVKSYFKLFGYLLFAVIANIFPGDFFYTLIINELFRTYLVEHLQKISLGVPPILYRRRY